MARQPWNDWYHITGSTYGSWLRGDPRGWRTRHHREHVAGDYKNPPKPGTWENLYELSKELMIPREAVRLSPQARQVACDVFASALTFHAHDVVAIAIGRIHYHVLARLRDHNPRKWIGIAKSRSARALSESGHCDPGGVWGLRCRCWPILDRAHQVATARYIIRHASEGAAIWRCDALGKV
ncbi:MAG: hypothetical protein SFY96_13815 [Planctomycetota bacterium]|nr:hypothetical protein [Planctomycetota bacterium]